MSYCRPGGCQRIWDGRELTTTEFVVCADRFLVSRDAGLADVVPTDLFDYLDWQQRPGSTTGVRVARLADVARRRRR